MFVQNMTRPWATQEIKGSKIFYKGLPNLKNIIDNIQNHQAIIKFLKSNKEFSSAVIETDTQIIAWVDHIRTWPLFYTIQDNEFFISPSAEVIKGKMDQINYNPDNLIEFKLSGYVTGKETLIDNLFCLNPGECLFWDKQTKQLSTQRYFSYIPSFNRKISTQQATKELGILLDQLTIKIIARAQNRPIWIPLSGGLDSRILLCKLHEHGYKNIHTFTYGPQFNFEGLIAKKIACKLNIPWQFIAPPRKILKQYFESNERKNFWAFATHYKSIPCMREYSAIRYLHENKIIPKNAIIINGQSGDYISGGHLSPQTLKETYTKENFYDVILNKHYDLWKQYKTPSNLALIKKKIGSFLKEIAQKELPLNTPLDGAIYEETWEYEGRQICYVVNGQRIYEFYGHDWEMPLWEKDYVDFFQDLPLDMKYGQKLFKDYLKQYNYQGLFPQKEPYIWRWAIPMLWVVPLAQMIGLFGRGAKDKFYALMRYWGHYANQYAFFDFKEHFQTANKARNVIALYVPKFLKENGLDFE